MLYIEAAGNQSMNVLIFHWELELAGSFMCDAAFKWQTMSYILDMHLDIRYG